MDLPDVIFLILLLVPSFVIFVIVDNNRQKKEDQQRRMREIEELEAEKRRKKRLERIARQDFEAEIKKRKEDQRLARLKRCEIALTFNTYELAEITLDVIDSNDLDKLHKIASALSNQLHLDEVLIEASKRLSKDYQALIEVAARSKCAHIDFSENEAAPKLDSLVKSCIQIGAQAIGKKIGHTASNEMERSDARGIDESNKSKIRKTRKWSD